MVWCDVYSGVVLPLVLEEFHYSDVSSGDFWLYFLVFATLFAGKEVLVYWCLMFCLQ